MLRNWGLVYIGNTVGAVSVALLYAAGGGYRTADSTVGNVIGGSVLVATVYWFIYLREIRGDTRP